VVRSADWFERYGGKASFILPAGAAVMVEATKQVHAPKRGGLTEVVRKPLEAFGWYETSGQACQRTRRVSTN
jgi:hypothetical protein